MTIAIQTTNASLAALEQLLGQSASGQSGAPVDGPPSQLLDPSGQQSSNPGSTILDVSGGATAALGGLAGGLASSASVIDAAVSAGGTVAGLLTQLQQVAQIASDPSLSPDQLSQLNTGFQAGLAQVQQTVAGASFDGVNLLAGGQAPTSGPASSLPSFDLSLGGPVIGVAANASLSDPSTAASLASQLDESVQNVSQAVGQIAAQGQAIQNHLSLVSQAASSLAPGLASGVNSALDGDGARLQALQVQQQLSGSGQAISNQSPQAILALFAN
jgi:flagellin